LDVNRRKILEDVVVAHVVDEAAGGRHCRRFSRRRVREAEAAPAAWDGSGGGGGRQECVAAHADPRALGRQGQRQVEVLLVMLAMMAAMMVLMGKHSIFLLFNQFLQHK